MLQTATLRFLKELKKNNNKAWFDENRSKYDAAKADVINFVQQLIAMHAKKDPAIAHLEARQCLFRINRDVRFSKDKSPYKTNFGASINADGKKSLQGGYYIHIEPGNSFIGGGMYQPPTDYLKKVRQEIDYNLPAFKKIMNAATFKKQFDGLEMESFSLTRVPKGYDPENPAADFLRLKSFIAMRKLPDSLLTDKNLLKESADAFAAILPLIRFINTSLD